jgi:hypothetical protein
MRYEEYKTADSYRIVTHQDALFYAAGIPYLYWRPFKETPFFLPINGNEGYDQASKFKKLQNSDKIFKKSHLVFVGAEDEDSAFLVVYEWMKRALSYDLKVQITDSACINKEVYTDETVFMLINVFHQCTTERLQSIRDWSYRHKDCFRIITMACDPYDFSLQTKLTPNAMLYLNSMNVVRKNYT